MPITYDKIQTITLSSSQTTVSFSSIPLTYTDLIIVCFPSEQTSQSNGLRVRVGNSSADTGSNYSTTFLHGNGTAVGSNRETSATSFGLGWVNAPNSSVGIYNAICQLQNYSNTTTFKTMINRSNNANQSTETNVGLWRSTVAINTIDIFTSAGASNQLTSGSIFSLYGIKAA
jgi:hypothetical protein